jgi:pSer/pThr/pTyr-binding forkhead associated (FHA) protein
MPYLVVMDGPQKGRRFAITDSTTRIGRVAGNHIVLDNVSVSSGHAEIVKGHDGFRLRDLDSTNGTRVNNHRVTDTLLFRDDEILLGDLPVVFSGEDAPLRQEPLAPVAPDVAEEPVTASRPPVVVASTASGKHAATSMPPDFRRRRDTRLFWIAAILLLLIGIGIAGWKFYHSLRG